MSWRYKEIYAPNHPNARSNGCVLEHRYVAEKKIGRILKKEEVVHHIDEDRANNSEENLIVFATQDDHARFHKTGVMIELNDGTFFSPEIMVKCNECGDLFINNTSQKYCSKKCYNFSSRVTKRPTKEELSILIHNNTFTSIGNMFNVSDTAVRKWCKSYGLPYKRKDIKNMGA